MLCCAVLCCGVVWCAGRATTQQAFIQCIVQQHNRALIQHPAARQGRLNACWEFELWRNMQARWARKASRQKRMQPPNAVLQAVQSALRHALVPLSQDTACLNRGTSLQVRPNQNVSTCPTQTHRNLCPSQHKPHHTQSYARPLGHPQTATKFSSTKRAQKPRTTPTALCWREYTKHSEVQ